MGSIRAILCNFIAAALLVGTFPCIFRPNSISRSCCAVIQARLASLCGVANTESLHPSSANIRSRTCTGSPYCKS
eukprot:scaffold29195_cov69-Cyclotella_meneghiniana.AAC.7